MAAVFTEDFEGGSSGSAITTANTAYNAVPVSGSGTNTFQAGLFGLCARCGVTAASSTAYLQQDFTATGVRYLRRYFKVSALPGGFNVILAALVSPNTNRARVGLTVAGLLLIQNGTTTVGTSTTVVAADTWYRVEWKLDNTGATQSLQIFVGANINGTTPDETITGTFSTGTFNRVREGNPTGFQIQVFLDAVKDDNAAYPGSYVASATRAGFFVPV